MEAAVLSMKAFVLVGRFEVRVIIDSSVASGFAMRARHVGALGCGRSHLNKLRG